MRRFVDGGGRAWDVVAGRESWGTFFAIFVPVVPGEDMRQTQLEADTLAAAERELDSSEDGTLRELLGRSRIKSLE